MNWRQVRLIDFIRLQRGFDLPKSYMKGGEVPVLGSNCVIGYHNESKVDPPGVVTGRSGTLGIVQYTDSPYWPHNTALWVRDFKGNHPKFVFYKLQTLNLETFNGGVSVPTLNRNVLDDLEVSIPDHKVQKQIALILSAYDDLIENNRRRMALLEESARQLYREWFVRLRFPGYEHTRIVDGVPEGWERKSAFDALQILSGGTPKTTSSDYWNGEIPFYTPKDAADGIWVLGCERNITDLGLKNCNSKLYPKETIFISARGTVGKINMAQSPMAMSQSCYALWGKNGVSQPLVYLSMQAGVDTLRQQAAGAVFDAIIVDTFKRIDMIIPKGRIVFLFDGIIRPIMDQLENLTIQNQKLRAARDLLLPRLMNGEIAV
jgi:type I restriction enzyme, S subunit